MIILLATVLTVAVGVRRGVPRFASHTHPVPVASNAGLSDSFTVMASPWLALREDTRP